MQFTNGAPKSQKRGTKRILTASTALAQTLNDDKGRKRRQLGRRLSEKNKWRDPCITVSATSPGKSWRPKSFAVLREQVRQEKFRYQTKHLEVPLGRKLLESVGSRVQLRCGNGLRV